MKSSCANIFGEFLQEKQVSELANKHYQGGGEVNIQAFKDVRPAVRVKWNEQILPRLGCCKYHCTVPQSQGDPKIVKRGPNKDPIFGKKGTQRGPFLT